MIFDIRNYGAIPDGKTLNTVAIQKAIDACTKNGGGRVLVEGGKYMTGTIILKDGVDLHIACDGVLFGSPDCADYPERTDVVHVNSPMLPRTRNACMIFADEAKNISISGLGTIDCNGKSFVRKIEGVEHGRKYDRINEPTPPRVVFFAGCKNVKVVDITMTNQPSGWSYWIHDCDYVTFDHCKIIADVCYPNNDGIHINCSRNVTVSNCSITCGDDCLIVRANNSSLSENKICERVSITNCNLTSYSAGIRIGWICDGVIKNCVFSNLVMTDCSCGISILLPGRGDTRIPDEGREYTHIENLSFNNIIMSDVAGVPISINIIDNPATHVDEIKNIYFSNIHADGYTFPCIHGRKDCRPKNIIFSDCSFERKDTLSEDDVSDHGYANGYVERAKSDMIEYAEGIVFNNTSFSTNK